MAGEVTFTLDEADYVAANRDWMRGAILNRRVLTRYAFIALGAFVSGMALAGVFVNAPDWRDRLLVGLAMLAYAAVLLSAIVLAAYLRLPGRTRRLFRQQTVMHKPQVIGWSQEGLVHRSAAGEGKYDWSDFYRWQDARSGILIFQTENLFHVLPARMLEAGQRAELVDLLTRHGPPRR